MSLSSWWRQTDETKESVQSQQESTQEVVVTEEGWRMVQDTPTSEEINRQLYDDMQAYLKANKK